MQKQMDNVSRETNSKNNKEMLKIKNITISAFGPLANRK